MVGDRNLAIWQEQQSVDWPDTRPVVESIWATAKQLQIPGICATSKICHQ